MEGNIKKYQRRGRKISGVKAICENNRRGMLCGAHQSLATYEMLRIMLMAKKRRANVVKIIEIDINIEETTMLVVWRNGENESEKQSE